MLTDEFPKPSEEPQVPNPTSLTDGVYAIQRLLEIAHFDTLLEDCGYDAGSLGTVHKSLQVFETEPAVLNSPYTGDFYSFRNLATAAECQLHSVSPTRWSDGGYHFIAVNQGQEDQTLFDDSTNAEVLLLRDKKSAGHKITPAEVFLDAMYTRCGETLWQEKTWRTYLADNIGKYTQTDWKDRNATINFVYPAKYPNAIPLETSEIHFRNFERHNLNGGIYNVFIRMLKNPTPQRRAELTTNQIMDMSNLLRGLCGPDLKGRYAN